MIHKEELHMMRLYSRAETAKKLGIGLATLDRLRAEGKIGFYQQRPNCEVQFTQVHIDRYLEHVERVPKRSYRKGG